MLQRKQKELDLTEKGGFAVEYYKMWSIRAVDSAYGVAAGLEWFIYSIIFYLATHTKDQAVERFHFAPYFMKFNGQQYMHINFFLKNTELLYCMGVDTHPHSESILQSNLIEKNRGLPALEFYFKLQEGYL